MTQPETLPASEWQPIDTAPKDGSWVLLWACDSVRMGYWLKLSQEPYWHYSGAWGVTIMRKNPPTHWRPPLPPHEAA